MNKLLELAMLAGGGWLLYNWFRSRPATTIPGAPPPTASTSTAPPPPAVTSQPAPANTLTLMVAEAAKDPATWKSTMSPHQWNYLYSVVRQKTPPAPPDTLTGAVTLQEWFDAMKPLGVSGLRSGYVAAHGGRRRR